MCLANDRDLARPETEPVSAWRGYRDELVSAGLLIPLGPPGLYARSGVFEGVVERFERFITRAGADFTPEVMRFPPLLARQHYLATHHAENFPNLMGSVHTFTGGEAQHLALLQKKEQGEDWSRDLAATDLMLIPAACYPLYPTATGALPPGGRTVDLLSFVFRHEPSVDPARMQSFRQREFVRLGTAGQAVAHRDFWLARAADMLRSVGLNVTVAPANDPFFGRGGRMMAAAQKEQDLKFELLAPVASAERLTAIASCNYHLDHFGHAFAIHTADGRPAHSACVGFGLERIALALFRAHGFDPARWPAGVQRVLGA
jgi:seryl-tRNA synthetase